jgi:hypothetical protein
MAKTQGLKPRLLDALERAQDCEDEVVIAACRRLIIAYRLGWKKHHRPDDWRMLLEFRPTELRKGRSKMAPKPKNL